MPMVLQGADTVLYPHSMDWRHLKAPAVSANKIQADGLETLPSHALVITKPRALLALGAHWAGPLLPKWRF